MPTKTSATAKAAAPSSRSPKSLPAPQPKRFSAPVLTRPVPATSVAKAKKAFKSFSLSKFAGKAMPMNRVETTVQGRIRENGGTLYLSSKLIIGYGRGLLELFETLRQRIRWGRVFAGRRVFEERRLFEGRRAQSQRGRQRALYAACTRALPFLLLARKLRTAIQPGHEPKLFLAALPATSVWCSGASASLSAM